MEPLIYKTNMQKTPSLVIVLIAYFSALFAAYISLPFLNDFHIIIQILFADIVATIIVYFFSLIFKNSSIYDPYWSIIPVFIFIYFFSKSNLDFFFIPSLLMFLNILFWSIRLTSNWIKNWKGMSSEDWRYVDMRKYSGRLFEFSNFFGIHLFPTLIVFACCIPIYYVLNIDYFINPFMFLGFFISFLGVVYEIVSDYQLYQFRIKHQGKKGIIQTGLWKYSRHPNYWGEILFWWGLYIYVITFSPWYVILAPISMTIMFAFVSIPWIENKILRTRPNYTEYQQKTNFLILETGLIKKILNK